LTASQFHCATVPDGQIDGVPTWQDGRHQRIEAASERSLKAHFEKINSTAVDHCTVCSRDDDLVDYKIDDRWQTTCRDCRDKNQGDNVTLVSGKRRDQIPADLSIPDFLRRTPNKRLAA
jgi:hypothetical protein